ncbi:hypothetical protein HX109_07205 [Galbibacter sp. BG1]|uniref:hypothetical protein n=1 Tax=Galbibacter sp. BG1 TaxID=1170699 RepID=UPI0015B8DC0F|nr:hypothetical protein [Galbibacter sp. BG1]QLE01361.1 hypothetical protein HX109_07205 [Galbibacter sp. BG1]
MRFWLLVLILFQSSISLAQKAVTKSVAAEGVSFVSIDASNLFSVSISTGNNEKIALRTTMEGEYQNEYINTIKEEGTTLFVGVEKRPLFNAPNDKLSAHKVVSVHLEIKVPKNMDVKIYGDYTEIKATGEFGVLELITGNKLIFLDSVQGLLVNARTQNGNIILKDASGTIEANSKYGKVHREGAIFDGNTKFEINSLNGNIYIQ